MFKDYVKVEAKYETGSTDEEKQTSLKEEKQAREEARKAAQAAEEKLKQ